MAAPEGTTWLIAWRCGACGEHATSGALHIPHRDVRAAEAAAKAWEAHVRSMEAFDLADIFGMPSRAQWQVTCDGCLRSHDCAGCYQIDLRECATFTVLLRWQAHLYDKSWFDATNWVGFVHRLAQEHAPGETAAVW